MKNSRSGQSLLEILVASVIICIIALQSAQAYQEYNQRDLEVRESLIRTSLTVSFSQMSGDPHLIQEMFFDENPALRQCLENGDCSKAWLDLNYDHEVQWAYSQTDIHFDFRALDDDLVELRMNYASARRPTLIWISRYHFFNLENKPLDLSCGHPRVITGIDYDIFRPICAWPQPVAFRKTL